MNAKKRIITSIIIFMLLVSPIILIIYSKKISLNVSELIEKEDINDLSLTIYYLGPYTLTYVPVSSVEDLLDYSITDKIVINGSDLKKNIDLFKQINNDVLTPVKKKSSDLYLRVYYVLESNKNGKLFDVAMWGDDGYSIFVNDFEVKENDIFYEVIIPYLSKDEAKRLDDFRKYKYSKKT